MTLRPSLKSKKARTIVLFFLLFLLLPFSFQCVKTPLDFKAPQWSVPLNIQLIDRTFTFGQMIEKDPKFITDSTTSHVEYRPSSIVNTPTAIILPELSPYQSSLTKPLGALELDVTAIPGVNVTAAQIFSPLGFSPPFTYPAFGPNLSLPMQQPVDNQGAVYDYVVFKNGRMTLTITNNFSFTLKFANPGVQLINTNMFADAATNDSVVATFAFPAAGIAPGTSVASTAILSGNPGKTMSAKMILRFTVQSDDIQGKPIGAGDNLVTSMTIDGGSATTKASMSSASIEFTKDQPVDSIPKAAVQIVDDTTATPTKIKRAEFKAGIFTITIVNNIATKIAAYFKMREFVDTLTGKPFELKGTVNDTVFVPARATLVDTVELVKYAIQSQDIIGNDTLSVQNINYSLSIRALKSTVGKVLVTENDFVTVNIDPLDNGQLPSRKTYILKKVVGKVKPTPVPINQTVDAAIGDIGNKFTADSIKFDSVSITLKILSAGSFPTDLAMTIVGLDKNGVRRDSLIAREVRNGVLSDTLRINPGVEKKIVFDKSTASNGHGIDQFLSSFFSGGNGSLPQQFIVTGRALVDPPSYYQYPESTGTVKAGDSVYTSVEFKFPVRVGIINGTYKDTIVISDTSGNKIDKKSLSQIDSGKVIFTINNAFPFQLDVGTKLFQSLLADKSKPDTSKVLLLLPKVGEIRADSARYGSKPDAPVSVTGTVIGLTPDDVGQINPASFIAVGIKMKTAGNDSPVEFKKDYYVRLKAFVSVLYNVDFQKK